MTELIHQAAENLWQAQEDKQPTSPIRYLIGSEDIATAYQIQTINNQKRLDAGESIVGKKIGLTSFAVQKQLGVDQPDYGMLFHSTQIKNGGTLAAADILQPKAEAEIAFVMKADVPELNSLEDLMAAIDYACAAIEIVGSRVENWDIHITDTIADNASASHFVLGENKIDIHTFDLVNCEMKLFKNQELVSQGSGKACMDNPLNAAYWLAQKMIENKSPLKKGEIVLSGALGPMVVFEKGDEITAKIEGMDDVTVHIV